MITKKYNPSPLETDLAKIITELKDMISEKLESHSIKDIVVHDKQDNPDLLLRLVDTDNDEHEVVVRFIQRPDEAIH